MTGDVVECVDGVGCELDGAEALGPGYLAVHKRAVVGLDFEPVVLARPYASYRLDVVMSASLAGRWIGRPAIAEAMMLDPVAVAMLDVGRRPGGSASSAPTSLPPRTAR